MEDRMDNEVRRIFLRVVVLKIISERPIHGYEIIKTVEARSAGRWTPSAGSIYPILECLERSGFIRSEEIERRKVYSITPEGEVALPEMMEKKRQMLQRMARYIDWASAEAGENGEA